MTLKDFLAERIQQTSKLYATDLAAMPHEMLLKSPGGTARTPYDFTYEIIFVNDRIVKRLQGIGLEPFDPRDWMKAPADFCDKEAAIAAFNSSCAAVLEEWAKFPEDKINEPMAEPNSHLIPRDMASLVSAHINYHDAQLNYIQTLSGDSELHWDF